MSWVLNSTLAELYTTLARYIDQHHELDPATTFFWICNFCIRQLGPGKMVDVLRLGEMVAHCGSTVMFLEPWDRMCINTSGVATSTSGVPHGMNAPGCKLNALSRVWCVYEVFHTLKAEAKFEVIMSEEEEVRFVEAVGKGGGPVQDACALIDIRKAESFDP